MTYEEESKKILKRAEEVDSEIARLKVLYDIIPHNDLMRNEKRTSIEHRLSALNHEHERLMERLKASSQERVTMDRRESMSNAILWVLGHPLLSLFLFSLIIFIIVFSLGAL